MPVANIKTQLRNNSFCGNDFELSWTTTLALDHSRRRNFCELDADAIILGFGTATIAKLFLAVDGLRNMVAILTVIKQDNAPARWAKYDTRA
jgi:hypothetical protein